MTPVKQMHFIIIIIITIIVLAAPAPQAAREVEHDEEQEKLIHRLDQITARLQHIDDELEKRLDPELKIKAQSLLHRLENLEG